MYPSHKIHRSTYAILTDETSNTFAAFHPLQFPLKHVTRGNFYYIDGIMILRDLYMPREIFHINFMGAQVPGLQVSENMGQVTVNIEVLKHVLNVLFEKGYIVINNFDNMSFRQSNEVVDTLNRLNKLSPNS